MAAAPPPVAGEFAGPAGRALPITTAAAMATLLSVPGIFALFSTAIALWALWTNDPLKSIGAFIPIISLVLILRVWRSLGWEMRGTWWGLVLLVSTIALVHLRDHAILELVLAPSWTIFVPPLPLQHVSALIARSFAHALGQPLTHDQLRLMFTPDFGMFIAPGCNGIRGAVTMGFIALIAGYIYRFRPSIHALIVTCAVLLGYVFNFARLCLLVVYYIIALHIPWLQNRAKMSDYIIGAFLFFFATMLLFGVIRHFSPGADLRPPPLPRPDTQGMLAPRSFLVRWFALLLVLMIGSVTYVRAVIQQRNAPQTAPDPSTLGIFPQQIGNYRLERRWNEAVNNGGPVLFYWADYRPAAGGPVVSVGVSPGLGAHDSLICHAARGEDWLWHGDLLFPTAAAATSFSGSFFNNGISQYLEATTICTGSSCGQYSTSNKRFGFVYSRPDTGTLLRQSPSRPIPVLLRTETIDTQMSAESAREMLTENLRNFLAAAQISAFSRPYR